MGERRVVRFTDDYPDRRELGFDALTIDRPFISFYESAAKYQPNRLLRSVHERYVIDVVPAEDDDA